MKSKPFYVGGSPATVQCDSCGVYLAVRSIGMLREGAMAFCDTCIERLHETTKLLMRQIIAERTERNKAGGRTRP